MKLILALQDKKAEMFMQPFFVPTVGVAYRNLQDEMSRGGTDNPLANHADDFDLWQLGTFDDETGIVDSEPAFLCNVASLGTKSVAG